MEYCKEMLGTEVYLVIYNENYGITRCKCYGQEIENSEWEWIPAEGYFSKIEYEYDHILFFAIYEDSNKEEHEIPICRRYIGDVNEWKKALWNEEPTEKQLKDSFHKASDFSIFNLIHGLLEDSSNGVFATREERDEWLEEFGRGD